MVTKLSGFVSPDPGDGTGHGRWPATAAAKRSRAATALPFPGPAEHAGRYGGDVHYCSMLAIDIKGFSDRRRGENAQRLLRLVMYDLLTAAFAASRLPLPSCHHEDRGDGVLVVAPPGAPTTALIDPLVDHLRAGIRRNNDIASELGRIRLRMAVHAGQVHFDRYGVCGKAVNYLFRMLEAAAFKRPFDASGADFALVASRTLYDDVISDGPGLIDPGLYAPITIRCKETRGRAWLYLPPVRNPFLPVVPCGTRKTVRSGNKGNGQVASARRQPMPESGNRQPVGGRQGEGRQSKSGPGEGKPVEGRHGKRLPDAGMPGEVRPGKGLIAEPVPLPAAEPAPLLATVAAALARPRMPVPTNPPARQSTSAFMRLMVSRDVSPKGWLALVHGSNAVPARFRGRIHPGQHS